MRDLKRLQQGAPPGDDDIMLRNAIIVGLGGTLFDGGIFKLTLKFTKEYPVKPPVVPFVSRMFHRNTANQQAATMLTGGRIDYYKKAQRIVELSWKAI
ncbi:UBC core domain-containing protein [Citrus sinensis]|uniref:UBC core domain-containing protein n=1 Tax=Citrus sinensis TaxID=2711 RepID=A0ACB8K5B3_CITSI|nr:UBC core domain-containing protein [Citrus sinensis]